ncbi:5-(carboxyamino)imidazole ribonucleotide mutase [Phosphitispora fastidiosa]|uniref:5-(carboxyamino)imidazole ribonucleotide mutase n=1 Tax=Phosphitispora fastidiosa TaxID=2837202 RepID=UPI001E6392AE|nr:5-(carboxyamino)imidazole ribonucleotide mutase [Phosphitispora fastidiosa]MBU7008519.1 5-(carboxyamino)imidazole ribonucleotide mutase [Phosphitispora fastidiosa]
MVKPLVGIVMGSDSDLKIMKEAAKILAELGITSEVVISSAHRVPEQTAQYARTAEERGLEAVIAGAGMAAHLPGVIAAMTPLPVIGIPIQSGALSGVDALYAIVQMPPGIPVATVAVNGAKNAGILAAQILSVKYPEIRENIREYKVRMEKEVEAKAAKLAELGIEGYLESNEGRK